jgi:AcrR family transcriptional regulator
VADDTRNVWQRPERGSRGPAPERSRAQITAAAVELADEGGLVAVSMRQVAKCLGTGPASLYRYVATRDELLDLMADAAAGEIDLSVPLTGDPVEDLTALAGRTKEVQLRHPWLLDLLTDPHLGPHGMDYLEYTLRALAPSSLAHQSRFEVIGLFNALVMLFARTELSQGRAGADPHADRAAHEAARAAHLAAAATEERHPFLVAALAQAADAPDGTPHRFERMMRRVLTGLIGTP